MPELNGVEVTRRFAALSRAVLIVTVYDADDVLLRRGSGRERLHAQGRNGPDAGDAARAILSEEALVSDRLRRGPDRAAGGDGGPPAAGASRRLTSREREVLQLLVGGPGNKEIASALGITTKTAETHRARIMAKLELHSISELVRYAIRNRIIEP